MKTSKTLFAPKTFALTVLLMAFGFGLFAAPGKGKQKTKKAKADITRTMSADEVALYETVESFYEENYTSRITETVKVEKITKVVVYDMAGNVLQEQGTTTIDLDKLPTGAKFLMKENGVHFYIVL